MFPCPQALLMEDGQAPHNLVLDAEGKTVSSEDLFNPNSAFMKDAAARSEHVLWPWRRISFHKTLDLRKVL